ncbi:GntR family transcriptional regulator [Peribacillus kribbensis]|uniref:GntR family transcriptional regulator n=1 Tax=Peribacillus kribbensis TaxID=356658 RepID=UPI000423580C|nr:GntR family transcriptional regulator [Peribacillus kribbensis]
MKTIKKTESLHTQAYHIVKGMIMEGKFSPGERAVESKIAEQLGVSRGTVREAVRMLTKDDLLVQKDGVLLVYNPDSKDIEDLYECRKSLESLSVKLAAEHISEAQLAKLEKTILGSREAMTSKNTKEYTSLNQQFHDIIAESSNNKQLLALYNVINTKLLFIRNCILSEYSSSFADLVYDHEQIFLALKERDSQKAEAEMLKHIDRSRNIAKSANIEKEN